MMNQIEAFNLVVGEHAKAIRKWPGGFTSPHHGISIIREEFEELWDEIKDGQSNAKMRTEAAHVAVTAIRFLTDLCK